jgi:hypothetical protein
MPSLTESLDPSPGADRGWARTSPGALSAFLAGLCVVNLVSWIPNYLAWPWWPDHDVFGSLAQAWDAGLLPYRDRCANNFPITIYLHWILGKSFGWGNTAPFYAVDAALVFGLGFVMIWWSRRRFGQILPALVGYLAFLGFYLDLELSDIAQRDWHSSLLAVIAVMTIQALPTRRGVIASSLAMGLAASIRPQAVLFLPSIAVAVYATVPPSERSWGKLNRMAIGWGLTFAAIFTSSFLPLMYAGVFSDFLRSFHQAAYGGVRDPLTVSIFFSRVARTASDPSASVMLMSLVLTILFANRNNRGFLLSWFLALLATVVYKPLSPRQHLYLELPGHLVSAVTLSVVVGSILQARAGFISLRYLAAVLALIVMPGIDQTWDGLLRIPGSLSALARGEEPAVAPRAYEKSFIRYPWCDYRDVLSYLRHTVNTRTRIANALRSCQAVAGPSGHLSALPSESMSWLLWVRPEDEHAFVKELEQTPGSVVVWSPREFGRTKLAKLGCLEAAIRKSYQPKARFGAIEVWRRKPNSTTTGREPGPGTTVSATAMRINAIYLSGHARRWLRGTRN